MDPSYFVIVRIHWVLFRAAFDSEKLFSLVLNLEITPWENRKIIDILKFGMHMYIRYRSTNLNDGWIENKLTN